MLQRSSQTRRRWAFLPSACRPQLQSIGETCTGIYLRSYWAKNGNNPRPSLHCTVARINRITCALYSQYLEAGKIGQDPLGQIHHIVEDKVSGWMHQHKTYGRITRSTVVLLRQHPNNIIDNVIQHII